MKVDILLDFQIYIGVPSNKFMLSLSADLNEINKKTVGSLLATF